MAAPSAKSPTPSGLFSESTGKLKTCGLTDFGAFATQVTPFTNFGSFLLAAFGKSIKYFYRFTWLNETTWRSVLITRFRNVVLPFFCFLFTQHLFFLKTQASAQHRLFPMRPRCSKFNPTVT